MDAPDRGSVWRNTKFRNGERFTREVTDVHNGFVRGIARWIANGKPTHHSFTTSLHRWCEMVDDGTLVQDN